MTTESLFALVGIVLFATGVSGILLSREFLRRILAFNIMTSGTFLVLVGLAQRDGTTDPIAHAMVLTGIVVAVAGTALALALARRYRTLTGRTEASRDD